MTFVFGFAALVIAIYCGVSFVVGITMLFALTWKLICLPFAIVRAIADRFSSPKARAIRATRRELKQYQNHNRL